MYPQIYIGHIPATAVERQALRARASDLRAHFQAARAQEPTVLLLSFTAEGATDTIDLLLLRPSSVIVGAVRGYRGPIDARPGDRWAYRDTGEPIREARDRTPIQHVKIQRDAVRDQLDQAAGWLLEAAPEEHPFERTIGTLIVAPTTHPDSRISLDLSEHRQQLKVLGLDELPALAAMVPNGPQLSESAARAIASEVFGGRMWHDGARFLFDLAPARFQLRVLAETAAGRPERQGGEKLLALFEGQNIVGRRRAAQKHEHRLVLSGDELISADHAVLAYGDDDRVTLRDISKNGTWVTPADGGEERVRGERTIAIGTLLRMGVTRMRLERVGA